VDDPSRGPSAPRARNVAAEPLVRCVLIGVAVVLGLHADRRREHGEHRKGPARRCRASAPRSRRTAWDLALATEALSYIDPPLAFAIADVYNQQQVFEQIQSSFLQNLFTPEYFGDESGRPALVAIGAHMGDVTYQEPHMLTLYDRLRSQLDSASGVTNAARAVPDSGRRARR
jgi:hypothetical protein